MQSIATPVLMKVEVPQPNGDVLLREVDLELAQVFSSSHALSIQLARDARARREPVFVYDTSDEVLDKLPITRPTTGIAIPVLDASAPGGVDGVMVFYSAAREEVRVCAR